MVKKIINTLLLCSAFFCQMLILAITAHGVEQELSLENKTKAIEKNENRLIINLALSIADINNDMRNEIAISGNGYMRIFEWNGATFEPKWQSTQFTYQYGYGQSTLPGISSLVTASYYSGKKLITDYLFFAKTASKSAEIYKITGKKDKYDLQKTSASPFNWFGLSGTCSDGSSAIIGYKFHQHGNYVVAYKWNGSVLVEKWKGALGTKVIASGEMLSMSKSMPNKSENVFLVQEKQKIGILSCDNDKFELKEVGKESGPNDLWRENRISYGKSMIGFTKKGSIGELWTVQYAENESDYPTKLYVSQFHGKKFSPFSSVNFKGVNSDMIFNMIITDVDNDGVGEIIGVEEKVRKIMPRKHPEDETDTFLVTSSLFLAKWNGKEYEVKWHRKAIDEKVRNITVGDVTGEGRKEIIITDNNGYFYVFDMPAMQ